MKKNIDMVYKNLSDAFFVDEFFFNAELNEEELKNQDLIIGGIYEIGGIFEKRNPEKENQIFLNTIWILSNKGEDFIFSDFDPDYEDEYIVNNVPFKRYPHYISIPDTPDGYYEAFAWYNPKESYVKSFKDINKAINWLIGKE